MDKQEYIYQLKPLLVPGGLYLILFPILVAFFWFALKIPYIELIVLSGIYLLSAIGIITLWLYGQSKRFLIESDKLIFSSISGEDLLSPEKIRKIALYRSRKGQECVQIKTKGKDYYLNELYFPFPELMAGLERFTKQHNIRTNFTSI